MRSNGDDAQETLSEGEKTFVTFLYFYYLQKGSNTGVGISEDRVVVFDDPVSSLDSDVLFIVSHLIKDLYQKSQIKQIFVLTHNIYFHKEVTFYKKRSDKKALKDETFWIIKKHNNHSVVNKNNDNPIKSSYELLWNEIRDRDQKFSSQMIQNVMRRIIENYFKIFRSIFDKSGHIMHYNMMMRTEDNELPTEDVEENIQLLEV